MTLKDMQRSVEENRRKFLFDESDRERQLIGEPEQYFLLALNALESAERFFAIAHIKSLDEQSQLKH